MRGSLVMTAGSDATSHDEVTSDRMMRKSLCDGGDALRFVMSGGLV